MATRPGDEELSSNNVGPVVSDWEVIRFRCGPGLTALVDVSETLRFGIPQASLYSSVISV
jgi:hypothetical protein